MLMANEMYKKRSQSAQRGAQVRERLHLTREELYAGYQITLSADDEPHFSFGTRTQNQLIDELRPMVRNAAKAGIRKPTDVCRVLNLAERKTACGGSWTPRLAWLLLRIMFGGELPKQSDKTKVAPRPKLRSQKELAPPGLNTLSGLPNPLFADHKRTKRARK